MPLITYEVNCRRKKADGTIVFYTSKKNYEAKGPKLTPEQIDEMRKMLQDGVKCKVICEQFKISHPTFNKYIGHKIA